MGNGIKTNHEWNEIEREEKNSSESFRAPEFSPLRTGKVSRDARDSFRGQNINECSVDEMKIS